MDFWGEANGGKHTTVANSSHLDLRHTPRLVTPADDIGKGEQQRRLLCADGVDALDGGEEEGLVVLAGERVGALDGPVDVVDDFGKEGGVVGVGAVEVAVQGADLGLVGVGGWGIGVGGVAVEG